jgi:flagellar L-ring protein precursor FlgH
MKVYDNGNMFIEGHRVVLVNNEEQHLYVSGVVRPIDIDEQNSIKSSMIASAEIEFVGQGTVSEGQQVPWGTRAASWGWPF